MISAKLLGLVGLLSLVSAHSSQPTTHSTTKTTSTSSITHSTIKTTSTSSTTHSTIKTTSTSSTTHSTTETVSTLSTSTTTPPPVPTVSAYGQCAGQGYSGPTVCEANTTCTYDNPYVSQCLPGPNYTPPAQPTRTTYIAPPEPTWSYVFSFGDSFTDTGFDLAGTKPAIGNQLGNPAWPGLTTCNGVNWVGDILIDNPGLLSYNFASGGATTDASIVAPKVPTALSFVDQVAEFTSNLVPAPAYAPWVTNNTFFAIWIGNTDVTIAYNQSNWSTLCQEIIDSYFEQVEILYNAGGRSFLIMQVPELESTPAMLLESAADQQAMTAAITQFNNLLNDETNTLITKLGGNQFPASGLDTSFAQLVGTQIAFSFMIENPTAYGAPNASCYNPDGVSCLWTDPYNPGQELQSLVGTYVAEIPGIPDYQ